MKNVNKKIVLLMLFLIILLIPISKDSNEILHNDIDDINKLAGNEIIKLDTPQIISVDDNYIVKWTSVDNADYYWIRFYVNDMSYLIHSEMIVLNGPSSNYIYASVQNGIATADITDGLKAAYKEYLKKYPNADSTVSVRISISAQPSYSSSSNYIESDESELSNEVYYSPNGSTIIDNISIIPNAPLVAIGRSINLDKTVTPSDAQYSVVNWSSKNKNIVTVNTNGVLTGVKKGSAVIGVNINKAYQEATVTVYEINSNIKDTNSKNEVIDTTVDIINNIIINNDSSNTDITDLDSAVTELRRGALVYSLDINSVTEELPKSTFDSLESQIKSRHSDMNIGGGYRVNMKLSYRDGSNKIHHIGNILNFDDNIKFNVNVLNNLPELPNNKVREYQVMRYSNGELEDVDTILNDEELEITSNLPSEFILLYRDVDIPVSEINVDKTSVELNIGEEEDIVVTFNPSNATNQNYTSKSSDNSIATVSNNTITAIDKGEATITFESEDGHFTKEVTVVVKKPIKKLIISNTTETMRIGDTRDLSITFDPEDTTDDKTITWTSDNPNVALVNSRGKVTGMDVGTTVIRATSVGGLSAECEVTVTHIEIGSVVVTEHNISLEVGKTKTVYATINPSNTTMSTELTWNVEDPEIAVVENGVITGLKDGSTRVSVTSVNGKTDYVEVEVLGAIPVYRMFNPINGEHLYTTDAYEVEVIYKTQGWGKEGIGWYSSPKGTPVYRLYNPVLGNHLYTSDTYEISIITTKQGWLLDFDGEPVMYSSGDVPIYRLFNPGLQGQHHLTTDFNEYSVIPVWGWQQEGVAMNAVKVGVPETTHYYK